LPSMAMTVVSAGGALVSGLQRAGVAASIKHFPGHGDTGEDSHTHLPRVERSRAQAEITDLKPFRAVIGESSPAMVMTAHIQYPCLDDSCLPGTDITVPATLSRRILTDLLRDEWGYEGVVITDALDMRAISEQMAPEDVIEACFRAGVDIALMPILVRDADSLRRLRAMVQRLAEAVRAGRLDEAEIRSSASRVRELQRRFRLQSTVALERVASESHRALEQRIAAGSLTLLQGELPDLPGDSRVHVLMPTDASASAAVAALAGVRPDLQLSAQSLERLDAAREQALVEACDVYLVGVSEPALAAVAVGGAEDLGELEDSSPMAVQQALLARAMGIQRVVVMLYSPYPGAEFAAVAEAVVATYDGAAEGLDGAPGPAYRALAAALAGSAPLTGRLPVRL